MIADVNQWISGWSPVSGDTRFCDRGQPVCGSEVGFQFAKPLGASAP